MNKITVILILLFAFLSPLFSWDQKNATSRIQEAQKKMSDLEYNFELKKYIPHDDYAESVISLRKASLAIEKKDFINAYYHSSMSIVKTETTTISALATKANYEKLSLERDFYKENQAPAEKKPDLLDIIEANLLKKGDIYRRVFPDKNIFVKGKYILNDFGQDSFQKIAVVLKNHKEARIKIIGHSQYRDLRAYTKRKAGFLKMFLVEAGIDDERVETLGVGNSEVMDTAVGFRRVDRTEVLITGIK